MQFSLVNHLLELYTEFNLVLKALPKHQRYTLGTRIANEILDILELVILGISKTAKSRLLILEKIDVRLKLLKLLVRLLHTSKALGEKKYIHFSEKLLEISKMNGGFIEATKATLAKTKTASS